MEAADLVNVLDANKLTFSNALQSIFLFDTGCLFALLILFVSNILDIIERRHFRFSGGSSWRELDPDFIKNNFERRSSWHYFSDISSLFSAIGLFSLLLPIFQVSWILSRGGKRKIVLHITLFVIALAGGICELVSNLLMTGVRGAASFLTNFEMSDWGLNGDGNGDGVGWRALEISYIMTRGLSTWINAFEWISLSAIFTILFVLVSSEHKHLREGAVTFDFSWAILGQVIGILAFCEFVSELLRTSSWLVWSRFSHAISIINLWILLPIWLILLGMKLPKIRESYYASAQEVIVTDEQTNPDLKASERN